MIVNHYGVEFGYELIAAIPFAYWLHQHGELTGTVSNHDTECLYYFSPDHQESLQERHYKYVRAARNEGIIPNITVHLANLDLSRWEPPPYNDYYSNDEFDFNLVVCNKYNYEWRKPPTNFIDVDTLNKIFLASHDKKILYSHMTTSFGRDDTVESLDLGEFDMVAQHKHVTTIHDLAEQYKDKYSLNRLQCMVYANCDNFITVQGGTSVFASYFSLKNTIFARRGNELKVGSYNWYNLLSGSRIIVVNTMRDLLYAAI